MEKKPFKALELNDDFRYALNAIEQQGENFFITGKAGTGKSTFLNLLRDATRKQMVVLAPTGVAAINVKGQTIHSFFGFPPRLMTIRDLKPASKKKRALYQNMEILVIDEISMVRADMLDNVDRFLRINRDNPLPFGGVQVVLVGDMFQLPPVVASAEEKYFMESHYETPFFFSAKVFEDGFHLEYLEFRKIYRQENRLFLRLLDAVRNGRVDYDDLEDLNSRYLPKFEAEAFYITLSARNATVNRINQKQMDKLTMPVFNYFAKIEGKFDHRLFPTEQILALKEGAQVMFLRNDVEKRFYNGTIGRIVSLSSEKIIVEVKENNQIRQIDVPQLVWEIIKYKVDEKNPNKIENEVLGTFTQFPLRPAWAITIHKSQGKTFDKTIIDMGRGAFAHGQLYVALSRCRTLEGIVLKERITMRDVIVDDAVLDFYQRHF
ncbi:MAG TPA: AAA family ATPase [Saprospiraceae bacterium]|nr:AAA family ATPase [Saprospiraceae bacterium]